MLNRLDCGYPNTAPPPPTGHESQSAPPALAGRMDPDLESASALFSNLDLNRRKKNIDDMDIDSVIEVSAGPERRWGEVIGEFQIPPYNCNSRKASAKKKHMHTHQWQRYGRHTMDSNSSGTATNDAEKASLTSKTLDVGPSSLPQDASMDTKRTNIFNGSGEDMSSFINGAKKFSSGSHHSRHRGSRRKKGKEQHPTFDEGDITLNARVNGKRVVLDDGSFASRRSHNVWQRKSERTGYLSPCNASKGVTSNEVDESRLDSSVNGHTAVSEQHDTEDIDYHNISLPEPEVGFPRHNHHGGVRKSFGTKRLVQSDALSPCNMLQENHAKGNWVRKTVHSELLEGPSSHQIHISEPRDAHVDRNKGKVLLDDDCDKQDRKAKPHLWECSMTGKEVVVITDEDRSLSEERGWRRTHDQTIKIPVYSLEESPNDSKRGKSISNCVADHGYEIANGDRDHVSHLYDSPELTASHSRLNSVALQIPSVPEPENLRRQKWKKNVRGKRKNNSVQSGRGGYRSAKTEDSETSSLQSSGYFPNSGLTRACDSQHPGTTFGEAVEVGELQPPTLTCDNLADQSHIAPVQSNIRVSQVESDEMLARELQEQFNHELSSFTDLEVDAALAWSLQQDDAHQFASMSRRSPFNHRDASMAHLYAYYERLPQSRNHDQTATSSRRDYYGSEMDYETRMMSEVRRSFNSAHLGREMRNDLLEALETAFDNSNEMFSENILRNRSDFNENDYEMLLALDENIHQRAGASMNQINSLPQSVVQSDNIEEACAICLETPSAGDIIRLLPCLHKFHKECVDTWLGRRSSCPVCKFDITI